MKKKKLLKADELSWFRDNNNNKLQDLYLPMPSDVSTGERIKDIDNMIAKDILGNGCKLYGSFTCPTCEDCLAKRLHPHFLYIIYRYISLRENKLKFIDYHDYRLLNSL